MHHNLEQYRSQLLLARFYAAHPRYMQGTKWRSERSGHVLIDTLTSGCAVASVVGRVIDFRLNCGPSGGYLGRGLGSLVAAKYQFQLAKPENTPFAADFDKVLQNIEQLQSATASSPVRRNFIVVDGQSRNLRFTRNIFEKRVSVPRFTVPSLTMTFLKPRKINPPDVYLDDLQNPSSQSACYVIALSAYHLTVLHKGCDVDLDVDLVDSETEHWPVSAELRDELDALKYEYLAKPLRVYVKDKFIEPADVNERIRGALIEVHFELHHYFIASEAYDSFNGVVEQILILQPGKAPPETPYKRRNVREGPIRLNPMLVVQHHSRNDTLVASGSMSSPQAHATSPTDSNVSSGSSVSTLTTPCSTEPDDEADKLMEEIQLAGKYHLLRIGTSHPITLTDDIATAGTVPGLPVHKVSAKGKEKEIV